MLRPGLLVLIGLTASLLAAVTTAGCSSKGESCGSACSNLGGGGAGTGGGDAGSDAPTTFLCKGLMCQIGEEACTVTSHFQQNQMGECTPLPAACAMPGATCDCFGTLEAECTCQQQPSGDFAIFCDYQM